MFLNEAKASHIVGGHIEIQLLDKAKSLYTIKMKLYFNELNEDSSTPNNYEEGVICQKRGNISVKDILFTKVSETPFMYSNEFCATKNKMKIIEVQYESVQELNPTIYKDPDGYYVAHNRCCRNSNVSNIVNSSNSGFAFYTEFPPLLRNGKNFYNSSPSFSAIMGEYVCMNDPFRYNFGAVDEDGDSLVYALSTPLKGMADYRNLTINIHGPYPEVQWQSGYNYLNPIPGSPKLEVDSKKGVLTITPSQLGLFVFAIECIEYRKIGKIFVRLGVTKRDFQLMVIDCPPPNNIPNPTLAVSGQIGNTPQICFGENVTIETAYNNNWIYQWEMDGDNIPGENNNTLIASKAGIYNVLVSLKNSCAKSRASAQITLKPISEKTKIQLDKPEICEDDQSVLTTTYQGTEYQFTWYKNLKVLSNTNTVQSSLSTNEQGKYFVVIKANNKPQQCPIVSDTVEVIVSPSPNSQLSTTGDKSEFCAGDLFELNVPTQSNTSVIWYKDGAALSDNAFKLKVSDGGNYFAKLSDGNCSTETIKMDVKKLSVLDIKVDSIPPICDGSITRIILKGTPQGGFFLGDGIVDPINGVFDVANVLEGKHQITYKIRGDLWCQSGEKVTSINIGKPTSFTLSPSKYEVFEGSKIQVSGPLIDKARYEWLPVLNISDSKSRTPTIIARDNQKYTLSLTNDMGCISKSEIEIDVKKSLLIPTAFSPNGDGYNDTWEIKGIDSYDDAQIQIYDRWGNMIYESEGIYKPFEGRVNGSVLSSGVYAYKIWIPRLMRNFEGPLLIAQ
ncbi:gliding motility-associated C-terminal domain-containing protein [Cellulophaga sp. BC115SP]|uniref:gliding motility-associated C-terminal domain-containing protein n=1 Tax=Cellulophaga sp. BC115SP TaxID=2683263 RepID=UPI0014132D3C|nr:gliding motility-associated C-terminal domain-containing protein [Cellulophaga sp. BC115SP]NBB31595.1 T9SS type B sorting domain-containing protein [Cellulophaga sp. BC115SP]